MIDIRQYGAVPDGVTDCADAINNAIILGDIIIENGTFLISESIKIPSNRNIYGKNAKIRLANNAFDNIFRNSDWVNGNENINIIGLGNFSIDANTANNNDAYVTYGRQNAESHKYVTISFYKVTNFSIKNLTVADFPHHCIHINRCSYGVLENIYLNWKTMTVNQDGIDIMWGSNNITIDGVAGITDDDFLIYFNGVKGDFMADYSAGYNVGDIWNITTNNFLIKYSGRGRFPSICAGIGNKVHDITMQNMTALESGAMLFSNYNSAYYGTKPTVDDIYNINIDNVTVNYVSDAAALILGQDMKDVAITNFVNNSGKPDTIIIAGTTLQNVTLNETAIS